MKKILYSLICIALVIVGCTKDDAITPGKVPTGPFPGIEIAVSGIADSTFVVTLTPAEGTDFYSYFIVADSQKPKSVDSLNLYRLNYKEGALKVATVDYEISKTTAITLEDLIPNTKYQVYAVAANKNGVPGDFATKEVLTTIDKTTPFETIEEKAWTSKGGSGTLTFNQPIKRGATTAKAEVTYYKINDPAKGSTTVTIHKDSIKFSGNSVTFNLEKPANGVYATITWEEGLIENMIDTKYAANTLNGFDWDDPKEAEGYTLRVPTKVLAVKLPMISAAKTGKLKRMPSDTLIYFPVAEWNTYEFNFDADSILHKIGKDAEAFVEYVESNKTQMISLTENLSIPSLPNDKDTLIQCKLPEMIKAEAVANFILKEGAFEDIYGNPSAEISTKDNYVSSYDYNIADILGTYSIAAESALSADNGTALAENNIVIKQISDQDSVTIEGLYQAGTVVKGSFNKDKGEIIISDWQKLGEYTVDLNNEAGSNKHTVYFSTNDEKPLVLDIPALKTFTAQTIWGYYAATTTELGGGWVRAYYAKAVWTKQ